MDQLLLLLFGLVIGFIVIRGAIALISWIEKIEDKDE